MVPGRPLGELSDGDTRRIGHRHTLILADAECVRPVRAQYVPAWRADAAAGDDVPFPR